MKRKALALLLVLCMLPFAGAFADDELVFKPNDPAETVGDGNKNELESTKDQSSSLVESLGKKDWEALAKAVKCTGEWRDDLVAMVKSQLGYAQEKDGMTLYTRWVGIVEPAEWSALFVAWSADQIGLTQKQFPQEHTLESLKAKMNSLRALKNTSRANYPNPGDLAFVTKDGRELVGVVVHSSNGYAAVIHGNDEGRVTRETYRISSQEFKQYVDLNVLMQRAGIEVGKGGKAPEIPEGGVAAWTNTNAVYLRAKPTIDSKSLTTVKKARTALLVTGAAMQEDGYIWYAVEYKQHKGYIRGDLLELDQSALPTATPEPTPVPDNTPIPGCAICRKASLGIALPEDCCYAHLAAMPIEEASAFMADLRRETPTTFVLYLSCVTAHVKEGATAILCLGESCGAAAWSPSGSAHAADCPWHMKGASTQKREADVSVREARKGQEIMLSHEVYGATAYKWYEVKSVDGAAQSPVEMPGEHAAVLTIAAKSGTYSYYCVATVYIDGAAHEIQSKTTAIVVNGAATLTICAAGLNEGESALVQVEITSSQGGVVAYHLALQNEPVTIGNLQTGDTYRITVLTDWCWRYSVEPAEPVSGTITANAATVAFQLTAGDKWIHDESADCFQLN